MKKNLLTQVSFLSLFLIVGLSGCGEVPSDGTATSMAKPSVSFNGVNKATKIVNGDEVDETATPTPAPAATATPAPQAVKSYKTLTCTCSSNDDANTRCFSNQTCNAGKDGVYDENCRANEKCDIRGISIETVVLIDQISAASCKEGKSWSHDSRGVMVWSGCRAKFSVIGAVR